MITEVNRREYRNNNLHGGGIIQGCPRIDKQFNAQRYDIKKSSFDNVTAQASSEGGLSVSILFIVQIFVTNFL